MDPYSPFWWGKPKWSLRSILGYFCVTRNRCRGWHPTQVLALNFPYLRARIKLLSLGLWHLLTEVLDVPILRFCVSLIHCPGGSDLLGLSRGAERSDTDFCVLALPHFLNVILLQNISIPSFAVHLILKVFLSFVLRIVLFLPMIVSCNPLCARGQQSLTAVMIEFWGFFELRYGIEILQLLRVLLVRMSMPLLKPILLEAHKLRPILFPVLIRIMEAVAIWNLLSIAPLAPNREVVVIVFLSY